MTSPWPQTCNYCGAPLIGGMRCPRCRFERKKEGSSVFTGHTSGPSGFVLTPLGFAFGDEDGSSGPTSLSIDNVTLSAGDVLVVGCGIDSGGSAIDGASWNSIAMTANLYAEGTTVGIRTFYYHTVAGGTGSVQVVFNQPVHSGVIIAYRLTNAAFANSGEETPGVAATTISKSQPNLTDSVGAYVAFVATLGPPTDDIGSWSAGYTQGERQGTTTGTVSNLTLSVGYNLAVPSGAHTLTYSGFTSREPALAVIHLGPA